MSDQAPTPRGPEPDDDASCRPCRGTGSVISGLGGEPHAVACPWCDGTGSAIPGHDAQAARQPEQDSGV